MLLKLCLTLAGEGRREVAEVWRVSQNRAKWLSQSWIPHQWGISPWTSYHQKLTSWTCSGFTLEGTFLVSEVNTKVRSFYFNFNSLPWEFPLFAAQWWTSLPPAPPSVTWQKIPVCWRSWRVHGSEEVFPWSAIARYLSCWSLWKRDLTRREKEEAWRMTRRGGLLRIWSGITVPLYVAHYATSA